jgi:hypothetical protein
MAGLVPAIHGLFGCSEAAPLYARPPYRLRRDDAVGVEGKRWNDGVNGILPALSDRKKSVDGRHKAGHDDQGVEGGGVEK